MRHLFFIVMLTGCTAQALAFRDLSPRKGKQKIAMLEKKLNAARSVDEKTQKEISHLVEEIYLTQLSLIEKEISESEKNLGRAARSIDSSLLFLKEREMLYEIIQKGNLSMAHRAEALLDRILRIITELSDNL